MVARLESYFPDLYEKLQGASSAKRKQAVLKACEMAVELAGVSDSAVLACLESLRRGETVSREIVVNLSRISNELDEQYFDLQDVSDDEQSFGKEVLKVFGQARAVAALVFFTTEESVQSASEAVYEAILSVEDGEKVVMRVIEVLD